MCTKFVHCILLHKDIVVAAGIQYIQAHSCTRGVSTISGQDIFAVFRVKNVSVTR